MKHQPHRLAERDDSTGRLLRQANAAYRAATDEDAAWRRLRERLPAKAAEPVGHWSRFLLPAFAAAAAIALYLRATDRAVMPLDLVAEPEPVAAAAPALNPALEPARASASVAPKLEPLLVPRGPDCTRPLEQLSPREAVGCLEQRAKGTGLDAERALVDLSALRRGRLRDPHGALAALRAHRERFPGGALRGEVDFALVELLPELGRVDEALAESAALLQKPWGRARISELRLLRAKLYQDRLHNCTGALQELTPIRGEQGTTGDEAEFRYAQCLERLGQVARAERAYTIYLARPGPRHESEARTRQRSLSAKLPAAP